MSQSLSTPALHPEHTRIMRDYLRAKDVQIPQLFARVFAPEATFASTFDIVGPFTTDGPRHGLQAITRQFRDMGQRFENIVTVVPRESAEMREGSLLSQWVVAMTQRCGDGGFVGWGTYRWQFTDQGDRADELAVHFTGWHPLTPQSAPSILNALLDLPHPWCDRAQLMAVAEDQAPLAGLSTWLHAAPPAPAGTA